jgi:hypothetical protein
MECSEETIDYGAGGHDALTGRAEGFILDYDNQVVSRKGRDVQVAHDVFDVGRFLGGAGSLCKVGVGQSQRARCGRRWDGLPSPQLLR